MKHTKQTTWELFAKTIRMRTVEKRALRERVVSYMEYHPMRVPLADAGAAPVGAPSPIASEPFVTMRFGSWQFRTFASVFALFLVVGVPMLAERAAPGDVLYLMKVNVNEEVLASLTWDSADKIAWETERVERRVEEARLLAQEGKLTEETEAQVAEAVREHTENASREIATLRTTDAEGAEVAQAALASTLDVQTAMLASESSSSTPVSLALAEAKIDVGAHDPLLDDALSADKLTALLELETTRTRALFASVSGSVTPEEAKNIERRISDLERAAADARIMHATGRRDQGFALQRATFGDIQKLVEYMTNIDVRANVTLESLVPVRPTPEERAQTVSDALVELRKAVVVLEAQKEDIGDSNVVSKFERGITDLTHIVTLVEDAKNSNDLDAAVAHIQTGRALITDLSSMMITSVGIPVPEGATEEETEAETESEDTESASSTPETNASTTPVLE